MVTSLLARLLANPALAPQIGDEDWNLVLRHARQTQLLGQLAAALERAEVLAMLPEALRRHLRLALLTSRARYEAAEWEIGVLRRAAPSTVPLVLLKGTAYGAAGDRNAEGRLFSDIDLLVPKSVLGRTEASFLAAGWMPKRVDAYDQRYYRLWMHEVPPLEHVRRHTVVDLHHAIVPPISRYAFSAEKLLSELVEIRAGVYVLPPRDRIIHCAIHLLQEGEASKVFRDLYDLYLLVQQHCADESPQQLLLARAKELGVRRLVGNAIGAAGRVFGKPAKVAVGGGWLERALVSAAYLHVPAAQNPLTRETAKFALLAHSHWMKMPAHILIPHLCRKAIVSLFAKEDKTDGAPVH